MSIKVNDIIRLVSEEFGVSRLEILSTRKLDQISSARKAVYGLARTWTSMSFPQIGRAIADRDHTTVLYGLRRFEERIRTDPDYERRVRKIEIALAYLSAIRRSNARVAA